jgi:D-alanyl-D-alanine carboxypeptidase
MKGATMTEFDQCPHRDVRVSRRRLLVLTATTISAASVGLLTPVPTALAAQRTPAQVPVQLSPNPASAHDRGQEFDPATQAAIERLVQDQMAAGSVPGMAVAIRVPGRGAFVRGYGRSDVATDAPFQLTDHVRIASITKTFTATEVLRLVDRGLLSLDNDRLSAFVPGVPYGEQITVRQLLNMTAGVFDFTTDPDFTAAFDADPLLPFTPQDVVALITKPGNAPVFPPGAPGQAQYSDSNYVLLGLIIEQVTHRPLASVLEEDVVQPAGLRQTSYPTTPDMPLPFAHGYLWPAGVRDVTAVNPAVPGAAGAMISTLGDLETWARVLATGTLLTPETQRQRLQFVDLHAPGTLQVSYGLGIGNFQGFIGHNGAIYGYNTATFYLLETAATLVVVSNSSTNFEGVATTTCLLIGKILYPELFPA